MLGCDQASASLSPVRVLHSQRVSTGERGCFPCMQGPVSLSHFFGTEYTAQPRGICDGITEPSWRIPAFPPPSLASINLVSMSLCYRRPATPVRLRSRGSAPLTELRACAPRKKRSVRCKTLHLLWRKGPCQPPLRPPPWHAHDLVLPDFAAQALPSQRTAPLFEAAGGQVRAVVVFAVNVRRHLPHLQHVVVGYRCDKPWIVRVGAPSEV